MSESAIIHRKNFKDHPILSRLLELHNPPEQLYIRGRLPDVTIDEYGRSSPRILTIVGSRKNTTYGKQALELFISSLKGEKVIILSGLALGIDGLAPKAALTHSIKTIAIPGSGLDEKVLYPSGHRNLAKDIISCDGVLISELKPETSAAPWTFPMRNRIMAALSDALLVIEAEEKSGTLITARLALELGRDIGAVPGEIFSPTSAGTNMLIHEGAFAVSTKAHLFSLLNLSYNEDADEPTSFFGNEKIIMDLLREPLNKDTLLEKSGLPFTDFLTAFSSLEINNCIQETFGEVRRIV